MNGYSWTVHRIPTDDYDYKSDRKTKYEWYAEVTDEGGQRVAQGTFPSREKAVQWADAERYNQWEMTLND